ncbi:hypothetical protein M8C21_029241 [Ambrosia artemisiifolia]|uniref:Uncharacterized protein n=1 Tax=Ambrosia artemisiifolia TaxID=4212 RepID=A0AAD5CIT7_AMBAR|nr:hypothetical protein M8C21_029241 [Ambrosia artemisiifolia]
MAAFCCPIETEPKTMNQVELNQVREVAVGVIKDNEPSEAARILNEGMKPVIGIEEMAKVIERKDAIDKLQGTATINEAVCQCSTAGVVSTPDQCGLKEPLSAPF